MLVSIQSLILVPDPYFNGARPPALCFHQIRVAAASSTGCLSTCLEHALLSRDELESKLSIAKCNVCMGAAEPGFESSMHEERGKRESAKYDQHIRLVWTE